MTTLQHIEPGRPARRGQLILERRFALAERLLAPWDKSETLLDLGCGNGAQTVFFQDVVKRSIGVDITPLSATEGPADEGAFDFIQCDASNIPLKSGSIDKAVSFEVLEHVPDDLAAARDVFRTLKPGGRFLFSVPNKWWLFESHGADVPGLNWLPWNRIPLVGWLPRPIHESIARARIYTMSRACRLARNAGFQVESSGYITAPLDVLPEGVLRRALRGSLFKSETTRSPFLAVNLYVCARKP